MMVFNTVLGEEAAVSADCCCRGCAPRSAAATGWPTPYSSAPTTCTSRGDPAEHRAGLFMAYPTRRWRSAWLGIIIHSSQSVVLAALTLALVLK
jgi:hypothetical protein